MFLMYSILGFIIVISSVVFFHELGHYIVAIIFGIKVEEFSIGFGKGIISRKDKRGTTWYIKAIPFGGYVKLQEDENQKSLKKTRNVLRSSKGTAVDDKNNFIKILLYLAGPAASFLLSVVIFTVILLISGLRVGQTDIVNFSSNNSPAMLAGLKVGDKITMVNDKKISNIYQLQEMAKHSKGKSLKICFERNNKVDCTMIKPVLISSFDSRIDKKEDRYVIGIRTSKSTYQKVNFSDAIQLSFAKVSTIVKDSFIAIKGIVFGTENIHNLSGPLKIAKFSGIVMKEGFLTLLNFIGILSAGLGFFNLLPIPFLDGGQALFYALEAALGKSFPIIVQKIFHIAGVLFITLILSFVIINDIISLSGKSIL